MTLQSLQERLNHNLLQPLFIFETFFLGTTKVRFIGPEALNGNNCRLMEPAFITFKLNYIILLNLISLNYI